MTVDRDEAQRSLDRQLEPGRGETVVGLAVCAVCYALGALTLLLLQMVPW